MRRTDTRGLPESRRLLRYFRSGSHEPCDRDRHGLYGFCPVVAITANVGTSLLGKDSFQEVDITGIVMPVTKHSYIVKDITKLADTIRKAFYIAKSGRPGPVLVDVTKDVTGGTCEYTPRRPATVNRETSEIHKEDVERAAEMIRQQRGPSSSWAAAV